MLLIEASSLLFLAPFLFFHLLRFSTLPQKIRSGNRNLMMGDRDDAIHTSNNDNDVAAQQLMFEPLPVVDLASSLPALL